jgi:hypothetical protein
MPYEYGVEAGVQHTSHGSFSSPRRRDRTDRLSPGSEKHVQLAPDAERMLVDLFIATAIYQPVFDTGEDGDAVPSLCEPAGNIGTDLPVAAFGDWWERVRQDQNPQRLVHHPLSGDSTRFIYWSG